MSHLMLLPPAVGPAYQRAGYNCHTSDADGLLELRLFNIEDSHKVRLGCISINKVAAQDRKDRRNMSKTGKQPILMLMGKCHMRFLCHGQCVFNRKNSLTYIFTENFG